MSIPKNFNIVRAALERHGITNPYSVAAILAIVSKESGFVPQSERGYGSTSNSRIREIFSATRSMSDAELNNLKKDDVAFFNLVYGGRYGNGPTEGFRYRGRGFNQLTFKDNYRTYGNLIGRDLVSNSDLMNDPGIAAEVVAQFMKRSFANSASIVKSRYGANNINDFKDANTALNAFYNANAGFGKDTRGTTMSGYADAKRAMPIMLALVDGTVEKAGFGLLGLAIVAGLFFF
jgi:predicted chitinase